MRPVVLLLVGDEGLRRFDEQTSDTSRQVALESILQMVGLTTPEPTWLLELVRRGKTMLDIGHELYSEIGPNAELERWNRALIELGFTSVVNPESNDQFETHLRAALTPLRAVLRSIVTRNLGPHSFRMLDRALGQLTPPTEMVTQYWELPFSETMRIVASYVEAQGAVEAEVQALRRALSLEELYIALDEVGLEPKLDPVEIYAANERELSSVCALVRSAVIVWSERNKQAVPGWVEDQRLGAASLERLGFMRRLDKDEWFQQLRGTLGLQNDGVLAGALLAAASVDQMLQALTLTENDLGDADAQLKSIRERALRAQRTINVCGQPFENEATNLTNLSLHILQCMPTVSPGQFDLAKPAPLDELKGRGSGRRAHGVGARTPRRKHDHAKELLVGIVGEMHAFRLLQAKYGVDAVPPSAWRSECSEHWFPGNGGEDRLGYDFVLQLGNTRYFIEVKSSEREPEDFELGSSEVAKAMEVANKKRTRFVILRVLNALSAEPLFDVLPNPYEPSTKGFYSIEEGGLRVSYRRSRIEVWSS